MGFGLLALAVSGIDIGHHRRISGTPWSIVAGIGPELARLRPPASGIEHRRRAFIGEHPLGSSQLLRDLIPQEASVRGCPAHAIRQGKSVELDALPRVDLGLAV